MADETTNVRVRKDDEVDVKNVNPNDATSESLSKKTDVRGPETRSKDLKQESEEDIIEIPPIKEVESKVKEAIVGQDDAVKQIITGIYRAIYFDSIKSNILVIGNSGTGKTETINQIANIINYPCVIEDATKYTKEGYYGADVEDMIDDIMYAADGDIEKAEKGILVIDEIDKKVSYGSQEDISGTDVLKSMLKIIEGTNIKVALYADGDLEDGIDFSTKHMIVIFLGAFQGLEEIREKRLKNKNRLGFKCENTNEQKDKEKRFLKQDLVEYGMPEEFVGRIDTIVEMNQLTEENLAKILKKSKLSIFKRYEKELKAKGVDLVYEDKLFENIAANSVQLKTGARELSNTVNYMFANIVYDIIAEPGKYSKCVLKDKLVKDNMQYELS